MSEYRDQLRSELVAAAARRAAEENAGEPLSAGSGNRGVRRTPRLLLVAAAIVVLSGALTVSFDVRRASADVFEVKTTETEVVVSVAGLVDDPVSAAAELREAGLDVRMVAVPVPPSLVGAVVAITREFGPLESENNGTRVTAFRIPRHERGQISVEYGRQPNEHEAYAASEPVPDCHEYAGQQPSAVRTAIAQRYGPKVVWQIFGASVRTDVPFGDLPSGSRVLMVLPLDPNSVLVAVTDDAIDPHPDMDC